MMDIATLVLRLMMERALNGRLLMMKCHLAIKPGCSHDAYYGQWGCGNRGGYPYYAQCQGNDEWSEWILCDNGCPPDNVKDGPSDPFAAYCD